MEKDISWKLENLNLQAFFYTPSRYPHFAGAGMQPGFAKGVPVSGLGPSLKLHPGKLLKATKSVNNWLDNCLIAGTISSPFFKTRRHGGFFGLMRTEANSVIFPASFIIKVLWVRFLK